MSEGVPVFDRVFDSRHSKDDKTVSLTLGVNESQGLSISIRYSAIGPIMAAIAAEAAALAPYLTKEESETSTTLNANAVWLSESESGNPMIVFELANGSLLPLEIQSGDLTGLADEMALLTAKKGGPLQ